MPAFKKITPPLLIFGDILFLYFSLWLTLFVRYFENPDFVTLKHHLIPFSIVFLLWILSFFIVGLYDSHTLALRDKISKTIFRTQIINIVLAMLFFYLIPYYGIAPKTNLFIYLVISSVLILLWRIIIVPSFFSIKKRDRAIIIGKGKEMFEIHKEVNNNNRYGFKFVETIDRDELKNLEQRQNIINKIRNNNISLVIIDLNDPLILEILPKLYKLIFLDIRFINLSEVYEDIFDKVPLSFINHSWFLKYVTGTSFVYNILKRFTDILCSSFGLVVSSILYPFVYLAIKIDDGGPAFITQERIGQGNKLIQIYKFRTMTGNDKGKWLVKNDNRVTRVGKILRCSRIDELPQLWNVLKGDLSLVGPRPDILNLGKKLNAEIPFYNIRYLIKPGLSGWAQINQNIPPTSLEESKERLTYDLFYVKNKSFFLDSKIILKTIKILLLRKGI